MPAVLFWKFLKFFRLYFVAAHQLVASWRQWSRDNTVDGIHCFPCSQWPSVPCGNPFSPSSPSCLCFSFQALWRDNLWSTTKAVQSRQYRRPTERSPLLSLPSSSNPTSFTSLSTSQFLEGTLRPTSKSTQHFYPAIPSSLSSPSRLSSHSILLAHLAILGPQILQFLPDSVALEFPRQH